MAHKRTRHAPSRYQDIVATEGSPPNRKVQCGVTSLALGKLGARVHVHSNKKIYVPCIYRCSCSYSLHHCSAYKRGRTHCTLGSIGKYGWFATSEEGSGYCDEAVVWLHKGKTLYEATIVGARVATRESAVQEEAECEKRRCKY